MMAKFKILILSIFISLLSCDVFASNKSAYLHFIKGLILERRGNYSDAIEEYKKTMIMDEEALFAYKQALNLAVLMGQFKQAEEWAAYIVKIDSATSDNWVLYGNVQWAQEKIEPAKEAFEKAILIDDMNADALYRLANISVKGDYKKALEYFEKYLTLHPENSAEVYYQMASVYSSKNKLEEMKKYLELAIKENSFYLLPRYMLAEYYEVKKDTAAAIAQYDEILNISPENAELFNYVGELYSNSESIDKGEKYFLKAYEFDNSNSSACFWLAIINEHRKDFKAAIKYLESSKEMGKDPKLCLRLSFYYTQSGGYSEAIKLLEEANKKWPDDTEIAYFLALGYDDTNKTEKSLGMLKEVVGKNPDNMDARMQYAVISEKFGDIKTAEENFRAILKKNPKDHVVLNYLGYSLADRGMKLDEAEKFIKLANDYSPLNSAYMDSLAWAHFKQGKLEEALKEIRAAIGVLNDDSVMWDHMGEIYWATENYEKAWYSWKVSSVYDLKNKKIREKLEKLETKLPQNKSSELLAKFLANNRASLASCASFVKIDLKIGSQKVKFDAIFNYKNTDSLKMTALSPFMTPMWESKYSISHDFEMGDIPFENKEKENLKYWLKLFMEVTRDYFSGGIYFMGDEGFKPQLRGRWLETRNYKLKLNENMIFADEIQLKREKKANIKFSDFKKINKFHVPGLIELKAPFSKIKIKLAGIKIEGAPIFALP
ncbi:MAG: tetratricopeptide repeat protein [Elusimicrobia bacterium]|nr:tetratricopeptide repeat protein [Elusimicrobiota bacterium]